MNSVAAHDPNPIFVSTTMLKLQYTLDTLVTSALSETPYSGVALGNINNLLMVGLLAPQVSLKTLVNHHDPYDTSIRINAQIGALVKNFAAKHGHTLKSAVNQLILSGLALEGLIPQNQVIYVPKGPTSELGLEQVKALRDVAFNRLYVKTPKLTRGRPAGRGRQYTLNLPAKLVSWLAEYHGNAGQLVERVMYNLLLSDVEFTDLRPILPAFDDVSKRKIIMNLQPWQEELLQRDMAHMGGNVSLSFLRLLQTARNCEAI